MKSRMRIALSLIGYGAALAAAPAIAIGQECVPLEVSLPEPKKCGKFNPICKAKEIKESVTPTPRTFTQAVTASSNKEEEDEVDVVSFSLIGCAGAIIAPVIEQENLAQVELTVVTPSKAPLFTRRAAVGDQGRVAFEAVELPQSGEYAGVLRTWARGERYTGCARSAKTGRKDRLGIPETVCLESKEMTGYRRKATLTWRGSAGLEPLAIGQDWRPTIESKFPMSRRLHLDAVVGAQVRVEAAGRVPVSARVSVARGSMVTEQRFAAGTGVLRVPAKSEEQFLVLRVGTDDNGVPLTALVVSVDSSNAPSRVSTNAPAASVGKKARKSLPLTVAQTSRIASSDAGGDDWEFTGVGAGQYTLNVVPSGRAGLVLNVSVYSETTEEVVLKHEGISTRAALPFRVPASGRFVAEVRATALQTPDADGTGLYTISLTRTAR